MEEVLENIQQVLPGARVAPAWERVGKMLPLVGTALHMDPSGPGPWLQEGELATPVEQPPFSLSEPPTHWPHCSVWTCGSAVRSCCSGGSGEGLCCSGGRGGRGLC